ncbi:MAG: DUF3106 domain-containing protein [Burkholderiales bacterium]|nr:DUF3106 domain-containing protein [Burkholderiales bacterium]
MGAAALAVVTLSVLLSLGLGGSAHAAAPEPKATKALPVPAVEQGVRWQDLKPAQKASLKPLERDWSGIDLSGKQKWLELSARFPRMSADERSRVQARMAEWAKMTPKERGQARLNYQDAKQVPAKDRQDRWQSYQALSPEQKRQLAARAARPVEPASASAFAEATRKPAAAPVVRETPLAKSNLVPNPAFAVPRKQVEPTVTRAGPGATTTLMSRRPVPPPHQQTGLPKIAATPEFVNKATLQPKRGPQAAATRSAKTSEAEPARRP